VDQDQRYRGRGRARDELSPIVRGARKSSSANRTRPGGSGRDDGSGARHGRDADNVSNDWVARAGRTAANGGWHGRSSLCTCRAKPERFCGSWQVWRWQIGPRRSVNTATPACKAASPPRSCPRPPSRLPFRAEPPMTTTRSLTVCPGLAARCAGAIDASQVRLVVGLARGRGPGGVWLCRRTPWGMKLD
jgi:hypothetical protein